jgi:hypothetical protein
MVNRSSSASATFIDLLIDNYSGGLFKILDLNEQAAFMQDLCTKINEQSVLKGRVNDLDTNSILFKKQIKSNVIISVNQSTDGYKTLVEMKKVGIFTVKYIGGLDNVKYCLSAKDTSYTQRTTVAILFVSNAKETIRLPVEFAVIVVQLSATIGWQSS